MFIILMMGGLHCRSSEPAKQNPSLFVDTTTTSVHPAVKPPAAIVQNVSTVEAVIENIDLVDDVHYTLGIFIVSSSPMNGRVSIIEPGQRVTVSATYVTDASGTVDPKNERNASMLSLRTVKPGVSFKGKIMLDQRGGWSLTEVENTNSSTTPKK
jgi:hypothetical protein